MTAVGLICYNSCMAGRGPFPGMDPWLESYWDDAHTSFATYARDQLNQHLPRGLVARLQQRVYVESSTSWRRPISPDVYVVPSKASAPRPLSTGMIAAPARVVQPELLPMPTAEVAEAYVVIWDVKEDKAVVTVIEFVSGTNKWDRAGRREYLKKQAEVLASDSHLVEIDLLRGGRTVTAASRTERFSVRRKAAPYHACVSRANRRSLLEYYPLSLREPLPFVPVPLREGDGDVMLDLQSIVDQTYDRGRYDDILDYSKPPEPPLSEDDANWAKSQLERWREP